MPPYRLAHAASRACGTRRVSASVRLAESAMLVDRQGHPGRTIGVTALLLALGIGFVSGLRTFGDVRRDCRHRRGDDRHPCWSRCACRSDCLHWRLSCGDRGRPCRDRTRSFDRHTLGTAYILKVKKVMNTELTELKRERAELQGQIAALEGQRNALHAWDHNCPSTRYDSK